MASVRCDVFQPPCDAKPVCLFANAGVMRGHLDHLGWKHIVANAVTPTFAAADIDQRGYCPFRRSTPWSLRSPPSERLRWGILPAPLARSSSDTLAVGSGAVPSRHPDLMVRLRLMCEFTATPRNSRASAPARAKTERADFPVHDSGGAGRPPAAFIRAKRGFRVSTTTAPRSEIAAKLLIEKRPKFRDFSE
jgi:hypothetical protein